MTRRLLKGGLFILWTVALTLVGVELGLRGLYGDARSYYTPVVGDGVLHYAFGDIPFNTEGHPDDAFDPQEPRRRVGYLGDSVTHGLGVPYGERFTEVLDGLRPDLDHRNYGKPGWNGNRDGQLDEAVLRAREHGLSHLVYVVNLNDIRADGARSYAVERPWWVSELAGYESSSALVSLVLARWEAYDVARRPGLWFPQFQPSRVPMTFRHTAARIRRLHQELRAFDVGFTAVLVPVEMQVSAEAARRYEGAGVRWEEGFVPHGAQDALLALLDGVPVLSALPAFVGPDVEAGRERVAYCELFICEKGGRLDWNHPNAEGHRLLGRWMAEAVLADALPKERVNQPR